MSDRVQVTQIHCPNCGNYHCKRIDLVERFVQRIECMECDYLVITCTQTHRVIEAYAPGIFASVTC